jgi:checkpoint serine/threonine-protein kinase
MDDAEDVYKHGIESQARPLARLKASYDRFLQRKSSHHTVERPRPPLTGILTPILDIGVQGPPAKRPKLDIFRDELPEGDGISSIFRSQDDTGGLGSIAERTKENKLAARPWSGEMLKQNTDLSSQGPRFSVFKDEDEDATVAQRVQTEEGTYTLVKHRGKKPERLQVDLSLLEQDGREVCLSELLLMLIAKQREPENSHPVKETPTQEDNFNREKDIPVFEHTEHLTIPLKGISESEQSVNEPTVTLYSKQAANEVMSIFNDAAKNVMDDDEDHKTDDTSNLDGFVTETVNLEIKATPPTTNNSVQSSPFIEQPLFHETLVSAEPELLDPTDESTRRKALLQLKKPLTSYPNYHEYTKLVNRLPVFKKITTSPSRYIPKGNRHSIIDFCGDEIFCLRCELGQGGFGVVYLVETETGTLRALKVETPSTPWEYYILNQVQQRIQARNLQEMVVAPRGMYCFQDESYMVMDYVKQGTLLDVVNYFRIQRPNPMSSGADETLCIYIAVELLKIVEQLHAIGIIHGDLKADNCMIRFEEVDEWSESMNTEAWKRKSITLIDFGRSIDLTLHGPNTQFKCTWEADEQDCPQMNNGEPWLYEADYYGVAGIAHTLLFGEYIKVRLQLNRYVLQRPLKRYWQQHLWAKFFDLLLNPYSTNEIKKPLATELQVVRNEMQEWLLENGHSKGLKKTMSEVEEYLNEQDRMLRRGLR